MLERKSTRQRILALLLVFMMIFGNVTQSFASTLSGTIKDAVRFTFTYVGYTSTNYHFTLESEDDKTWYGTCMDPNDQQIPYEGMSVSMSKVADDAMIARIAYEGNQRTDLSVGERRYIISRAAAYYLGRIDSYSMVEDVDKLLKDAKNRSSIPENFVVYKTAESDYGQQLLAWRTIKATTIQVNKKAESSTSYSLAGAKYGLYTSKADANNHEDRVGTMTTDKDGDTNTLTLHFTGEKTYYVKEYKAPEHFGLDDKVYSKTLKEGGSWTINSTDPLLEGSAKVKKVTTVDAIPEGFSIAGAVYGLYGTKSDANSDTDRLKTLTTKESGISNTVKLDAGTYYVKEVSCPDWLQKDKTVHTVKVEADETAVVNSTDPVKPGKLKVEKQTHTAAVPDGQSIAGAVYGVYDSWEAASTNGKKGRLHTMTTKENGSTESVELDPGLYYVREISCPNWLDLDENIYPAEIVYGQTKTLVIKSIDGIKPGYITLKKTVAGMADYSIEGAEYGVFLTEADALADSNRIDTLITDGSGNTNTVQVEAGKTYYVKETKAPDHYQLDETIYTAYVPYGDRITVTVTSEEKPNPGFVQITKTTKTTAPHANIDYSKAGARYGIFQSKEDAATLDEALALEVLVTDTEGNTPASSKLQPGTYYVRETKAPPYMELDDMTHTVRVRSDETATITSVEPISSGRAKVKKTTAHSDYVLAECNEQYSLAGAEYTVYASPALTAGSKVGTLVTDASGNTEALELTVGEYWIIETKASPGFQLDGQGAVKILIEANQVTEHQSVEIPLMDPINIVLNKTSGNQKENAPSLAGAIFKVRYYTAITDQVEGLEPARTWLFESKLEDGEGVIRFHDNYKVGGDDLYKDDKGLPMGLIGTYVITEEVAPTGYIKDPTPRYAYVHADGTVTNPEVSYDNQPEISNNPKEFQLKLEKEDGETGSVPQGDASLAGAIFGLYRDGVLIDTFTTGTDYTFTTPYYNIGDGTQQYTVKEISPPEGYLSHHTEYRLSELEGNNLTVQYTTVERTVKNEVIKGKVAITKILNAQSQTGALMPEAGAAFEIYLTSAGSYDQAKAAERDLMITDGDGYAETKMLPYGTYTVHQRTTTEGYEKCLDFTVEIKEHNKIYRYTMNDDQYEAEVQVTKVDAETGKVIPAGGATFRLRETGSDKWIGFPVQYPYKHEITEFVTDAQGSFQFPEKIPFGSYELVEVVAPEGYVISAEPIPFVVDGSKESIALSVENNPQKGIVEISKKGEMLQHVTVNEDGTYTPVFEEAFLEGAVFDIYAKTDISTPDGTVRYKAGEKVHTVTTDASGIASSKPLYLGAYEVKERIAGENHVLDAKAYTVELVYDEQKVQVSAAWDIKNDRQKASIVLKKNLEEDQPFGYGGNDYDSVFFGIYADEIITAKDGTSIPKGGLVERAGLIEVNGTYQADFSCDLPHGSFYVQEIETAEGYLLDDQCYPVDFAYTDQNQANVEFVLNEGFAVENEIVRGEIAGHKISDTKEDLSDAVMGLFAADETTFTEKSALLTATSDAKGSFSFKDIPYGDYIVRETKSPRGYALNPTLYPVSVKEDGQVISLEIVNEITKFDISKTDITTGDYVIGAQLSIIPLDKDGNPDFGATFVTWITENQEYRVEGLEVGKSYMLRETLTGQAWDCGYVTAEDIIFTIPDTGEIQKVEMKDDYTKVEIQKTDAETGELLAGAVLQILTPDGSLVCQFESTDEPYIMTYLPVGDYILREIQAPEGYVQAEDMMFEVKDTGEVQTFALENEKIVVPAPEEEPTPQPEKTPESKPEKKPEPVITEKKEPKEKEKTPKTGDENHPLGWMMIAILGISSLIAGTRRKE